MYGFGVLIGIIIAEGQIYEPASIYGLSLVIPSFGATFGFFTALFIQAGTFALNDYCDLESDIANQRQDRPLVRGELSKKEALLVSISATTLGIIIASFLHPVLFILAFISGVLGILYDLKMKEFLAVSNIYIALTMAIPFIFGGLIVEPDRIDLVLLVWNTQSLPWIDSLHTEYPHQASRLMTTNIVSSTLQFPAHPPASVIGEIQIDPIHLIEDCLILLTQPDPFVIQ